jgi:hypothetical protein
MYSPATEAAAARVTISTIATPTVAAATAAAVRHRH